MSENEESGFNIQEHLKKQELQKQETLFRERGPPYERELMKPSSWVIIFSLFGGAIGILTIIIMKILALLGDILAWETNTSLPAATMYYEWGFSTLAAVYLIYAAFIVWYAFSARGEILKLKGDAENVRK